MKREDTKAKNFDILHFVADNAGLSTFDAIEKAYYMGVSDRESCEDAISRQDVLDLMQMRMGAKELYKAVYDLPSVTSVCKQKWIPVSERLPKPYTYVNAICRSLVDDIENWVVETMYLPIPKENDEQGYSDWGNIPMLNLGKAEVIAWMERKIPEPYKADNRTEQGLAYADQDTMMPAT